jgi:N-acetylglutamate synthase-like GNAT family acetyltransferase
VSPTLAPAYVARVLPFAEWEKLDQTQFAESWRLLPPEHTRVIVVEHEGQIVGCWALMTMVHIEGLWIHPDHRKRVSVPRKLYEETMAQARDLQVQSLLTQAVDLEVMALLAHVGAQALPGTAFLLPVPEKE